MLNQSQNKNSLLYVIKSKLQLNLCSLLFEVLSQVNIIMSVFFITVMIYFNFAKMKKKNVFIAFSLLLYQRR